MSDPNEHSPKPRALWPFFVLGLILIVLFWGVNVGLTRWNAGNPEPEEAARSLVRIKYLADLRAEESAKLESYAWADRTNGTVQIPIKVAMKQILPVLVAVQPHAAYPVATPVPVPAATPAPAAPTPAPQP